MSKFELVSVVAPASVHQGMLEEQKSEARVIKCNFGSTAARQTAQDYFEEMCSENNEARARDGDISHLLMTPNAVTGSAGASSSQTGEATATLKALKKKRGDADDSNFKNLTDWLGYLKEVLALREAGHTLVRWEDGPLIGFVDHETSTLVRISISDIRACRRDAKEDPTLMAEYEALAPKFSLESVEDVLTASRLPSTRAFILGPCEYGIQSDHMDTSDSDLILVDGGATETEVVEVPDLQDLWADRTGGSFLAVVPDLGSEDRNEPVVDERL